MHEITKYFQRSGRNSLLKIMHELNWMRRGPRVKRDANGFFQIMSRDQQAATQMILASASTNPKLRELLAEPGNQECADCSAKHPNW